MTDKLYFFELTTSPNTIWVEFDGLDYREGATPQQLDPYDPTLVGDVTAKFQPQEAPF